MPDVRPIDANALEKYIRGYCRDCNSYNGIRCRACNFGDALDAVDDAPTLDYEPVRHGEWGEYETPYGFPSLNGFPCSVCGMHQTDIRGLYYCPNCGAKMDGGKSHE